ncbi:MAG: hypothetical protein FWE40_08430 [Oscillospiraceae bacterium]|nr:hypothetical protein [Oscillospiraceae bacterium]
MDPLNVGVGAWLLRRAQPPSMHMANVKILDQQVFAQWQAEQQRQTNVNHNALLTLLDELWQTELTNCERAVLQGLHIAEKTEAAVARELGLHHSKVGRIRRVAQEKLQRALGYAMRYHELIQQDETGE